MPSAGLDPSNLAAADLRLTQHGPRDRRVYRTDLHNMATIRTTSCTTHKNLSILLTSTLRCNSAKCRKPDILIS
jgi:hypothetical protein